MVHECVPAATSYAFRSHPRRVFSASYSLTGFFHGGNTGSNPVGDANKITNFRETAALVQFGPVMIGCSPLSSLGTRVVDLTVRYLARNYFDKGPAVFDAHS